MTFRLLFHGKALLDLTDCYRWAARRAPVSALKWIDDAIEDPPG